MGTSACGSGSGSVSGSGSGSGSEAGEAGERDRVRRRTCGAPFTGVEAAGTHELLTSQFSQIYAERSIDAFRCQRDPLVTNPGRALEQQSGGMTAQSVMAGNGGHRGWRHEGAVTMAPKEKRESASVVAGGRRPPPTAAWGSTPPSSACCILLIWGVTVCHMASVDEPSALGGDVTLGGFPLMIDYHSYRDDVDGQGVRVRLFHFLGVNLSCSCLLCGKTWGPS